MRYQAPPDDFFHQLRLDGHLLKTEDATRPWGFSILLRNEVRDGTIFWQERLLEIVERHFVSLHKHVNFDETWIGSRAFVYFLEDASGALQEHSAEQYERVVVPRGRRHAIVAGNKLLTIFELATGTVRRRDNIKFEHAPQLSSRIAQLSAA